ncbi:MAG TPA: redox-sensitive transcriptional activator SoxR [Jatrophihabitantaceae bacterium]|jgi:MerR family redox-sensitive transcriptional activator SoxR|nr:redox-sensitive transcriptional activator SoxR [Jatrophihabitantaceae bacterium]
MPQQTLTIGEVAARSGIATSALRFYEARGLIQAERASSGHRRYDRSVLRRIAFIAAAQRVGLTLRDIADSLATLPDSRTPTRQDWVRLSRGWRPRVQERIDELVRLRDDLTGCIGCGCLSLRRCALFNPADVLGADGPGARRLPPFEAEPARTVSG